MNIEINGINAHYISEGSGETVLLLHGWGCNGEVYRVITAHLSERYRIVIPDLPGFGKTPEPPRPWGVGDYADFVKKFCLKTGLDKCILFGHSLGGRILIKLLSEDNLPFKTERAIITGGAGIKPKKSLTSKVKGRLYKAGRLILNIGIVKRTFPNALENLRKRNGSPDYLAASPMMRQCLVKIVNEDLSPLLSSVKISVLLIWGENDDQTPLSDGQTMEKHMPDAGLAVIKGAGHYAFLERGGLFCDILDAFLK